MKAIEARPSSIREIERAHRHYLESIQPLIKLKANLLGLVQPRILIRNGGSTLDDIQYIYTEEQQALLDQVDQQIEAMQVMIFKDITLTAPHDTSE